MIRGGTLARVRQGRVRCVRQGLVMQRRVFHLATAAALVISCAPVQSGSQTLAARTSSTPYRWLTTAELEFLLRGNRMVQADFDEKSLMRTPEEFHQDGRYVRHADNYEANGKYSFRDGAVCDKAYGDPEVCRKILVDKSGQHWIVGRQNPRILIKISITSLR